MPVQGRSDSPAPAALHGHRGCHKQMLFTDIGSTEVAGFGSIGDERHFIPGEAFLTRLLRLVTFLLVR